MTVSELSLDVSQRDSHVALSLFGPTTSGMFVFNDRLLTRVEGVHGPRHLEVVIVS